MLCEDSGRKVGGDIVAVGLEFVSRVLLATGCGALIGLERQDRSRTAGLRTHSLVAARAAAFVLFGEQAGAPAAPLQITAYVVSAVGFLGGGVILRQGFSVQGLNTAATLWCSAAVGCQAAGGHVLPALALTGIVLIIHTVSGAAGDGATVQLRVEALIEGNAGPLLDGLVGRLSLEPGVREVSWQAADNDPYGDDDLDDQASRWRWLRRRRIPQ